MNDASRWDLADAESTPAAERAGSTDPGGRPDEKALLLRHRDGDPDAFRHFVDAYKASVFAYLCRSGVPERDREDLFQDVFIKIHRAADRYREDRDLHPWVFTIVVNTTRSYFRRHPQRVVFIEAAEALGVASSNPTVERELTARQALERLEREILELPPRQREALLLAVIESMSMRDISLVLKAPVNTVKTWLRRARARLLERLP